MAVGTRFPAPVQTGPEAHPASCTKGTGSFPGVRCGRCTISLKAAVIPGLIIGRALVKKKKVRPGRDADPSPPSSAEVKNKVELYLYSA
jgi:hypothetical protein